MVTRAVLRMSALRKWAEEIHVQKLTPRSQTATTAIGNADEITEIESGGRSTAT